jgi:hypothetical protein
MFVELDFKAGAGLRRAGVSYVRAAVMGAVPAPLTTDRSGCSGQRLEMELGYLLRGAGKRQPSAFARLHGRLCATLRAEVAGALQELRRKVPGYSSRSSVYAALVAVEPGAGPQVVHSDAPDRGAGSYTTVIVPLTPHRGRGTTEFAGPPFTLPRPGCSYAFNGRVAHRGGANLSREWRCALCVVVCSGSDPNRLAGGCRSWGGHF